MGMGVEMDREVGSEVSINGKGIEGRVGGEEEEGGMEGKRVYQ